MSKLVYYIGVGIAASVLVPLAFAQTFTFNTPTSQKENTPSPPYSAEPLPVTTPENFKSGVQTEDKQVQAKLDQQVTQSLKPVPAAAPKAPPPPPPKPDQNTTTTSSTPTQNKIQQKPTKSRQVTPPVSSVSPVNTPPPAPIQQPVAPPPAVPQAQPYTGFGSQTPPSSEPAKPSSSGLNIQY